MACRTVARRALLLCSLSSAMFAGRAWADPAPGAAATLGKECTFQREVRETCGGLGCVLAQEPDDGLEPEPGAPGTCQPCRFGTDQAIDDCGGEDVCQENGQCRFRTPIEAPEPLWPQFLLLTTNVTFSAGDGSGWTPAVAPGFQFQGALGVARAEPHPRGGWIYPDLPRWYFQAGAQAALALRSQDIIALLGLSYYTPGWPLAITSLALGGQAQRQGSSVFDLTDASRNLWRAGPAFSVNFLYNLSFTVGYVFHVGGDLNRDDVLLVSIGYMQDLLGDLVPDRYLAKVPEELRPPGR